METPRKTQDGKTDAAVKNGFYYKQNMELLQSQLITQTWRSNTRQNHRTIPAKT